MGTSSCKCPEPDYNIPRLRQLKNRTDPSELKKAAYVLKMTDKPEIISNYCCKGCGCKNTTKSNEMENCIVTNLKCWHCGDTFDFLVRFRHHHFSLFLLLRQ